MLDGLEVQYRRENDFSGNEKNVSFKLDDIKSLMGKIMSHISTVLLDSCSCAKGVAIYF